MKSKVCSML